MVDVGKVRHGVEGGAGTAACVWELERARIECREGEVECRAAWEVERSGRDELIARCSSFSGGEVVPVVLGGGGEW